MPLTSPLELVAVVASALAVWLSVRRNIGTWPAKPPPRAGETPTAPPPPVGHDA